MSFEILVNVIASIATALSLCVNLPQVYLTVKNRNFEGLSTFAYFIYISSSTMWIIYAILMNLIVFGLSSALGFLCSVIILTTYYCCPKKQAREKEKTEKLETLTRQMAEILKCDPSVLKNAIGRVESTVPI